MVIFFKNIFLRYLDILLNTYKIIFHCKLLIKITRIFLTLNVPVTSHTLHGLKFLLDEFNIFLTCIDFLLNQISKNFLY